GAPPLVSSSGAPAALAMAPDELSDDPSAEMLTAPTALMERSVHASTLWFAIVSASATPIAASLPSVSPRALVSAEAVCDAPMCAAPLSVIVLPEARYAYVVTFESAMLMAGATATPVAEAPVFASVFIRFVVIADTL